MRRVSEYNSEGKLGFAVVWDQGFEFGFKTKEDAARYISRVCIPIHPGVEYNITEMLHR